MAVLSFTSFFNASRKLPAFFTGKELTVPRLNDGESSEAIMLDLIYPFRVTEGLFAYCQ
jgi:hypothetical protein